MNENSENWLILGTPTTSCHADEATEYRVRKTIDACASTEEFVTVYDSHLFQAGLRRIRQAMGCIGPEVWAEQWSRRMCNDPTHNDIRLNMDRKNSLHLLYVLCDRWKDPFNTVVTEATIQSVFKTRRLVNILQLVLPMDRAQSLFSMTYPGSVHHGMHWVSRQNIAASTELAAFLKDCGGFATINKRLVWLFESEVLGLKDIGVFRRWMEPQLISR